MAIHGECRVVVTFDDGSPPQEDDEGDVYLDASQLLVSYWDEEGPVVLVGSRCGENRFELLARSRPRKATLERVGRVLEGRWTEGDDAGGLRVELARALEGEV